MNESDNFAVNFASRDTGLVYSNPQPILLAVQWNFWKENTKSRRFSSATIGTSTTLRLSTLIRRRWRRLNGIEDPVKVITTFEDSFFLRAYCPAQMKIGDPFFVAVVERFFLYRPPSAGQHHLRSVAAIVVVCCCSCCCCCRRRWPRIDSLCPAA